MKEGGVKIDAYHFLPGILTIAAEARALPVLCNLSQKLSGGDGGGSVRSSRQEMRQLETALM